MAIDIDTPVAAIEGIGPAIATAFGAAGIHTVCDLLRTPLASLHPAVSSLASEDEVVGWRQMAALMQVAEVSAQWAEALVRGGVEAIDELHRKRLDELDTLFRQAAESGTAPAAPHVVQIAEMLKDAGVLRFTGALLGTVLGPAGQPVANALLEIGGREGRTDARGRFRIIRIPLGRALTLRIEHADFAPLTVDSPAIAADASVIGGSIFTLAPAGAAPAPAEPLSELAGDELPRHWDRTRRLSLEPPQLRERDLVMVHQFYETAPDASLVSLLRSWRGGELLVHTMRVPRTVLPPAAKLRDQFRVVGGALTPVSFAPLEVHRYRIDLAVRKAFSGRPHPTTNDEWRALLREQFEFRAARGYYAFGRRTE